MPTATSTETPRPAIDWADRKAAARAWPDTPWEHPDLADFVAAHAAELAPLIEKARSAGDAFGNLRERQRAVADQDAQLQADLLEAAGDEADRLITQAIALHVEKQTLPARLAEHERRFIEARAALLEAIRQMATTEARALDDGIGEQRRELAAIDRQLMQLDNYGTRPEIKEAKAELIAKRLPLARAVAEATRQFTDLRDVAAMARVRINRGERIKAA